MILHIKCETAGDFFGLYFDSRVALARNKSALTMIGDSQYEDIDIFLENIKDNGFAGLIKDEVIDIDIDIIDNLNVAKKADRTTFYVYPLESNHWGINDKELIKRVRKIEVHKDDAVSCIDIDNIRNAGIPAITEMVVSIFFKRVMVAVIQIDEMSHTDIQVAISNRDRNINKIINEIYKYGFITYAVVKSTEGEYIGGKFVTGNVLCLSVNLAKGIDGDSIIRKYIVH